MTFLRQLTCATLLSLCALSASQAFSATDSFQIKPYLFSILGQKIGIAWQYSTAPSGPVQLTLSNQDVRVATLTAETDGDLSYAILPVPACGFGKSLSYQVTGQSAPVTIEEIPCSDSTDPVKFSFMADTQDGTDHDKVFAQNVADFPSQAVLNGGDLVQTGTDLKDWIGFFESMEAVGGNRVLYPTPGNHEYRDDKAVPMWNHFFRTPASESHYSFDLGAVHVIALNSNFEDDPSQRTSQLPWLEAELQRPSAWKVVYFHHPGYSVGFFTSAIAPRKEYEYVRQYYIPLFEKYHVDLVLNGHVHLFETSLKNGVHYLIVGPAGGKMGVYGDVDPYKLKSADVRSIVNLEASPAHLRALSTGIDGTILDDLILTK